MNLSENPRLSLEALTPKEMLGSKGRQATYDLLYGEVVQPLVEKIIDELPDVGDLLKKNGSEGKIELTRNLSTEISIATVEELYYAVVASSKMEIVFPDLRALTRNATFKWILDSNNEMEKIMDEQLTQMGPRALRPQEQLIDVRNSIRFTAEEARVRRHQLANLKAVQMVYKGKPRDFRKPVHLSAEKVTDETLANELYLRHQKLNRAVQIVDATRQFHAGNKQPIADMRKLVANYGGFLQQYTPEKMVERIRDKDRWVIYRALGQVAAFDGRHWSVNAPEYAADIQVEIPDDDPQAQLPFKLPNPKIGDTYDLGEPYARMIRKNHAIAGCVSDLCCEDHMSGLGLAGTARFAAFDDVARIYRKNMIRFLIAEIFVVEGVTLPDKSFLPLEMPLSNTASQIAHVTGRHAAVPAWTIKHDEVPVPMPGDEPEKPHKLKVSWKAMLHHLEL